MPWLSFRVAMTDDANLENPTADQKALVLVRNILSAYDGGKVKQFNANVDAYRDYLDTLDPTLLSHNEVEAPSNQLRPVTSAASCSALCSCSVACRGWSGPSRSRTPPSLGVFT